MPAPGGEDLEALVQALHAGIGRFGAEEIFARLDAYDQQVRPCQHTEQTDSVPGSI